MWREFTYESSRGQTWLPLHCFYDSRWCSMNLCILWWFITSSKWEVVHDSGSHLNLSSRVVPVCPYVNAKQQSEERIPSTTLLWAQLQDLVEAPEQIDRDFLRIRVWQKMKAEDARMDVPRRISWLQVPGSICKHLHLFWYLHLQTTKEHKKEYLRYQAAHMEHIETYWNMVLDDEKKLHFLSPLPRPQMQTEAIKDC